ncbi:MAG TPA: transposase [Fimbriimonadaceae bacterium]|nr:transposase [Fimbriimonadaceae bacterium]
MSAAKHYRNSMAPGVPIFATTTVLDFVHAFHRSEPRDEMVRQIARHCRRQSAVLYGYAVMPHHIHLVVRPRPNMNGPGFLRILKRQSGEAISKLLTEDELAEFDQQRGLNGNTFWQYSFRSIVIESEEMFWEKMHYTHMNPVEAGYVDAPEEYRWSSARLVRAGAMSRESGLPYQAVIDSLGARG